MLIAEAHIVEEIYKEIFQDEFTELYQLFEQKGEFMSFAKGEFIFVEGNSPTGFYWFLSGCSKICTNATLVNEQIITLMGRGDFGGITACMNQKPYAKSCISIDDDTSAIFIPIDAFFTWFAKYPIITLPLLKMVENKIDRIERRASQFIRKNIEQRVAEAMLLISRKFGTNEDGFLNACLSPQEYASLTGTTRTSIYRIFRHFEDEKWIEVSSKRIRLLNPNALHELNITY